MLSCFIFVQLFATLWTVVCQVPLSMEFSRQEYISGFPCPPSGDRVNSGTESTSLTSPALAGRFFTTRATCEALKPWVLLFNSKFSYLLRAKLYYLIFISSALEIFTFAYFLYFYICLQNFLLIPLAHFSVGIFIFLLLIYKNFHIF